MDIKDLLNKTAAGQIALNLDIKDGNAADGKITKSVWDEFWAKHGGDAYKGKNENVGANGVTVEEAFRLIMTRIFNYKNKHGGDVDDVGNQFFNSIENHKRIDAGTVIGTDTAAADNADNTSSATASEEADGVDNPDGNDETEEPPKTEQYTTESIKVKVPKKHLPYYAKSIITEDIPEGRQLANEYKQNGTIDPKKITKYNVAYFVANIGKFDLSKNQPLCDSVFKCLIERLSFIRNLSGEEDKKLLNEQISAFNNRYYKKNGTEKNIVIAEISKLVRQHNQKIIKNADAEKKEFNDNMPKMQRAFDAANKLLVEVANDPPDNIASGHNEEGNYDWKITKLPDGRWIMVEYDTQGEIYKIRISYDTKTNKEGADLDEIGYTKEVAAVNIDSDNNKYDYSITSGYNWKELVKIAKSIFGKDPAAAQE